MLDKIGDLPAHPLIVHLPIVLGPVVGVLAILCLIPSWRDKLLLPTAGLAVIFAISAFLATESGESLAQTLQLGDAIEEHEEAAETLRLIAFIFAIAAVGLAVLRGRLKGAALTAGALVLAALGVATIGFTIKTGHEGAKVVWQDKFEAADEAVNAAP